MNKEMSSNNEIKIKSVKYNFIMNVILKASSVIFPLITFPYVSRVLGAANNGKIAFAVSFVSYFTMFAVLGIPTYGVKACAAVRDDRDKLSKTVHELLFLLLGLTVISYFFFFAIIFIIPSLAEDRIMLIISSVTIALSSLGIEWFYQAIEQYGYITYRNIAVKLLSIVLMFIFVRTRDDYIIYGAINVIGSVGSNVINIARLKKFISLKRYDDYNIKQHLRPVLMLFLYVAAVSVYTHLDSVMLKFMTDDVQVGLYSAATKIKLVVQNIVTSLGVVLLPKAAYYLQNEKKEEYTKIMKKSFDFIIFASFSMVALLEIISEDCILFLAGDQYVDAIPTMMWILPTIIFIGLSSTTGTQILIPSGRDKYATLSTGIGAVVDFVLNFMLIPLYGAVGAAIATLIAEASVSLTQIFVLRFEIGKYIDIWNNIKCIIIVSVSAISALLFRTIITFDSAILRMACISIVYFTITFILSITLKEKTVYSELSKVMKRYKGSTDK